MAPRKSKSYVKTATKKVPTLSPGMKTAIKQVVAPAQEIKYIATQWTLQSIGNAIDSRAGANLYPLLPSVQTGTAAYTRLGNSVAPKTIKAHFAMYIPQTDPNVSSNIYVRLLCLSSKEVKSYTQFNALQGVNLFLTGDNQSVGDIPLLPTDPPSFTQNLQKNQFAPVNTKSWTTHHDKIYHLVKNTGTQNYQGRDATGGDVPNTSAASYHRITVPIKHSGLLKYDSAADYVANNFAPIWCAYAWSADGSNNVASIYCATRTDMTFQD